MKKLIVVAGVLAVGFSSASIARDTYLPIYVEQGLISICKAAASDKLMLMNQSIKSLRLKHKVIALKVVCNGQDIISFAERYGAVSTTARLSNSIGAVNITDIASIRSSHYDVTFTMN